MSTMLVRVMTFKVSARGSHGTCSSTQEAGHGYSDFVLFVSPEPYV